MGITGIIHHHIEKEFTISSYTLNICSRKSFFISHFPLLCYFSHHISHFIMSISHLEQSYFRSKPKEKGLKNETIFLIVAKLTTITLLMISEGFHYYLFSSDLASVLKLYYRTSKLLKFRIQDLRGFLCLDFSGKSFLEKGISLLHRYILHGVGKGFLRTDHDKNLLRPGNTGINQISL